MRHISLDCDFQPPTDFLDGRSVLVTGAGGGIGRAIALASAAHGAEVILLDRLVRNLEATYDEIVAAGGQEPALYPLDLEGAMPEHYDELANTLQENFGGLDALVHNAARLGALSPLQHYDPLEWIKVMQVNLNAPFFLTRSCLPLLRVREDARLLFVSDEVAIAGKAYWGAYGASKWGLEGLMQIAAEECESEGTVRVMSVDPGVTATSLRANAYPAEDRTVLPGPTTLHGGFLRLLGPEGRHLHGHRVALQRTAAS